MSYFDLPFKCSIYSSNFSISKPSITSYNHRLLYTYKVYDNYGQGIGKLYEVYNGFNSEVFYSSNHIYSLPKKIGITKGNISAIDVLCNYFKKNW